MPRYKCKEILTIIQTSGNLRLKFRNKFTKFGNCYFCKNGASTLYPFPRAPHQSRVMIHLVVDKCI